MLKKSTFLLMVLSICVGLVQWSQAQPLRDLIDQENFSFGTAVGIRALQNDEQYGEILAREFNLLTTENALKFRQTEPEQGRFTFDSAEQMVTFAEAHNMKVRGHTLLWHEHNPNWVENNDWSKEEAIEVMRNHIKTVVEQFKGRIYAWDVVNEVFEEDGSYRDSVWHKRIGPEFIELAFQFAHEADPDALLFYNDFNNEGLTDKSDAVYEMVKDLKDRGVPIDGVGFQMHLPVNTTLPSYHVKLNMDRLAELGLQVHITEFDVRIPMPASQGDLQKQANLYKTFLDLALVHDACDAFITWGFTDKYSWIPRFFEGYGDALMMTNAFKPKPAYEQMQKMLRERKDQ